MLGYMQKLFISKGNPDHIDTYVVDDTQTVTWGELMHAIDSMGWFIDEEKPMIRRGAQWILAHVVRSLKVRIMASKGLLK